MVIEIWKLMYMLLDDLKKDSMDSLKRGEKTRVDTLRYLISAIRNLAIAKYGAEGEGKITDADVLDIVKKQVKTHKESVEAFEKAYRNELAQKEKDELAVLVAFLPKEISDEELKAMLSPIAASGETNFGLLMKQAMAAADGKADGGRVSKILNQLLNPTNTTNPTNE